MSPTFKFGTNLLEGELRPAFSSWRLNLRLGLGCLCWWMRTDSLSAHFYSSFKFSLLFELSFPILSDIPGHLVLGWLPGYLHVHFPFVIMLLLLIFSILQCRIIAELLVFAPPMVLFYCTLVIIGLELLPFITILLLAGALGLIFSTIVFSLRRRQETSEHLKKVMERAIAEWKKEQLIVLNAMDESRNAIFEEYLAPKILEN